MIRLEIMFFRQCQRKSLSDTLLGDGQCEWKEKSQTKRGILKKKKDDLLSHSKSRKKISKQSNSFKTRGPLQREKN